MRKKKGGHRGGGESRRSPGETEPSAEPPCVESREAQREEGSQAPEAREVCEESKGGDSEAGSVGEGDSGREPEVSGRLEHRNDQEVRVFCTICEIVRRKYAW